MGHKIRVGIEGITAIIVQQLKVTYEVNHQKGNQKQSRQTHDQFSTDQRSKKA